MTGAFAVVARHLAARYGRREVFHDVSLDLRAGQAVGVVGENGAGKTTLLRMLVGLMRPAHGDVRIAGLPPEDATRRIPTAYFAGEATLPGRARASTWARLLGHDGVTDRRRLRTLSRGARQIVGLRAALAPSALGLIVLDEPWEGLDPDGARWLTALLTSKRDRGSAVIVSSHRLHDLAGLCDAYLFVVNHRATFIRAFELSPVGPVTASLLADAFDRLRGGEPWVRGGP
ncbi:MAG: ATP-binding cassette domain-containing protein [Vicinamibacterales bacterium]